MTSLMQKVFRHIKLYLSQENRELKRISNIPRYKIFSTQLLGFQFNGVDSSSFIGQYNDIIRRNIYKFNCNEKTPLIIDCGSNIGLSIVNFKMMLPNSKIIGFEPDPDIFDVLRSNINNSNFSNVTLHNAAVWIDEADLSFVIEGAAGGNISRDIRKSKSIKVKALDLKNFLNKSVALLKIDIEGAELDIIKDIDSLLINVQNIFIEFHSVKETQQNLHDILYILSKNGFRYYLESSYPISDNPFIDRELIDNFDNLINIFGYRT